MLDIQKQKDFCSNRLISLQTKIEGRLSVRERYSEQFQSKLIFSNKLNKEFALNILLMFRLIKFKEGIELVDSFALKLIQKTNQTFEILGRNTNVFYTRGSSATIDNSVHYFNVNRNRDVSLFINTLKSDIFDCLELFGDVEKNIIPYLSFRYKNGNILTIFYNGQVFLNNVTIHFNPTVIKNFQTKQREKDLLSLISSIVYGVPNG